MGATERIGLRKALQALNASESESMGDVATRIALVKLIGVALNQQILLDAQAEIISRICESAHIDKPTIGITVIRVDAGAECGQCGRQYSEHPVDEFTLSAMDREPFLRIGCDGTRLKT